jgi:hypothetical protein
VTIKDNVDENGSKSKDNIFEIMDGIIAQLNKTKKMFIIMILTIMIIPPISFAVTFALVGPHFHSTIEELHPTALVQILILSLV